MRMFSSRSCQTMANRTHETQSTHNNKQPKHRTATKGSVSFLTQKTGYPIFLFICISTILSTHLVSCNELEKSDTPKIPTVVDNKKQPRKIGKLQIHNFTIPRNDPNNYACIRMMASLYFETKYISSSKNGTFEKHVNFTLNDLDNFKYFGTCGTERNLIEFEFLNDWNLKLYFYKSNNSYIFNHVVLYYKFIEPLYPHANHNGAQAEIYNRIFINTSLTNSFVCKNGIRIDLGNVILYLQNLQVEPFFDKRDSYAFDRAVVCSQDKPPVDSTSMRTIWLTILIVGIIVVCFILFIVFRVSSDDTAKNQNKKREFNSKEYNSI